MKTICRLLEQLGSGYELRIGQEHEPDSGETYMAATLHGVDPKHFDPDLNRVICGVSTKGKGLQKMILNMLEDEIRKAGGK